ncbi:MAG: LTA synthase family protein [Bacteroidota bacterium]
MLKSFFAQGFHYRLLGQRLLITLLLLSLCRVLFLIFNGKLLPEFSIFDQTDLLLKGLRFDLSAMVYINALLILGHIVPFPFRSKRVYQNGLQVLFLITNAVALIIELGDIRFFVFGLKRSTANLTDQTGDLFRLLPQFLTDFWYLVVIFIGFFGLGWWLYAKTKSRVTEQKETLPTQLIWMVVASSLLFLAARGGFQGRPLMPISALDMVRDPALAPAITNTTIHFIHSTQQRSLKEQTFIQRDKLMDAWPLLHDPTKSDTLLSNENVVIILLESFGKEVIGKFNKGQKGFTPFLDSLIDEGLYFEHSFANGTRSNQAVVSITTGIPSMMDDPFMISKYQGNTIEGFPKLLSEEGYTTAFFHGGNNGTFHFDKFAKQAGFDHYFGRNEYGDGDYDGNWGIFDGPYFRYTGKELDKLNTPFCALLFSLTSHHPYTVEKAFEEKYPEVDPLKRSILYTDNALREFFAYIRTAKWFDNTLFVITADHAGKVQNPEYATAIGYYKVPILFYKPDGSIKRRVDNVIQHVDIMPTILDYLNYPKPYFAFGRSAFSDDNQRYAFTQLGGYAQIMDKEFVLRHTGQVKFSLHFHQKDTFLQENIITQYPEDAQRLELALEAAWQLHHHTMIYNKLTVDSWRKWK